MISAGFTMDGDYEGKKEIYGMIQVYYNILHCLIEKRKYINSMVFKGKV